MKYIRYHGGVQRIFLIKKLTKTPHFDGYDNLVDHYFLSRKIANKTFFRNITFTSQTA